MKERLLTAESTNPDDVTNLLFKELEMKPTNVDMQVRLIRHLLNISRISEAYNHVNKLEKKYLSIFTNNLQWCESVCDVFLWYYRENVETPSLNWEFWFLWVSSLNKLVSLILEESIGATKPSTDYINAVFTFDQTLKLAAESTDVCPDKHLLKEFVDHHRGQLCLHLATLAYKQAKNELIKYKDVVNFTLPLMFAAYNQRPADLDCSWARHAQEDYLKMVQDWHKEASYRCSQIGHIILSITSASEKMKRASQGTWRQHVFKQLFITRDHQVKISTSYFVSCPNLEEIICRTPDPADLAKYDDTAQLSFPDSLHHYIWIGLNKKPEDFSCAPVFDGLPYSQKNLNNCAAESMNILDIDAFLYCSIMCSRQQMDDMKNNIYYPSERPNLLPAAVTRLLGTHNQIKWFNSAYKSYKNEQFSNFGEVRLLLIR